MRKSPRIYEVRLARRFEHPLGVDTFHKIISQQSWGARLLPVRTHQDPGEAQDGEAVRPLLVVGDVGRDVGRGKKIGLESHVLVRVKHHQPLARLAARGGCCRRGFIIHELEEQVFIRPSCPAAGRRARVGAAGDAMIKLHGLLVHLGVRLLLGFRAPRLARPPPPPLPRVLGLSLVGLDDVGTLLPSHVFRGVVLDEPLLLIHVHHRARPPAVGAAVVDQVEARDAQRRVILKPLGQRARLVVDARQHAQFVLLV